MTSRSPSLILRKGTARFATSLLPDGLKKLRRGITTCHNPDSGSDGNIVPGGSGSGTALNVDPKVAPYLNIETMELNEICPQSLINQYYIPVCSSPQRRFTRKYPFFPEHWQLREAQLITVGVLLSCHTNRFIFCCGNFITDYHEPLELFNEGIEPVMRFTGWGDLCQFLDPTDEVYFME